MTHWFLQEQDWNLGDFIVATPALHSMSRLWGEPIPVYFDTPYIASAYQDCPFIKILHEKPQHAPFGDNKYQRSLLRNETDPEDVAHHKVLIGIQHPLRKLYIDPCLHEYPVRLRNWENTSKHVAFFVGCHHPRFIEAKRVDSTKLSALLDHVLTRGYTPVLLGTKSDQDLFWGQAIAPFTGKKKICNMLGALTLRETLNVIGRCQMFVSNDTGLYHAATALGKEGVAIWGDTPRKWNSPNYSAIKYMSREDSVEYIKEEISRKLT